MLAVATSWYLIISATRATYPYSAATNSGVSPAWFCLDSSARSSSLERRVGLGGRLM
jgi:hypothetical protein